MRKIILLFSLLLTVVSLAQAQDYKKFKFGIGLGYGVPDEGSGGVLIYLEPMYRVMDQLAIGLRIETAAFLGQPISGTSITTAGFAVGSYTVNGQYYFGNSTFRPFVGAGFGMFTAAGTSTDLGGGNVYVTASTNVFGFYPRIGFDLGHFNLSIDYNLIPSQSTQVDLGAFGTQTQTSNNSYIGIRIGASIGGGKN